MGGLAMSTSRRRIAVAMGLAATVAVSALIVAVAPSRATFRGPNGLIVAALEAT
jgi:hypothetical protein